MNKHERISLISKLLDEYFPHPKIPLNYQDAFTLLIAVLLSAQTTDKIVNQVTKELFEKAPTAERMSDLTIEEIQRIIHPCGLSGIKAKAIKTLSGILLDKKFHGQVPACFEELEKLPGVGHKTASVVLSQGFGIPAFPVDTHIHRCAKRWKLSSGKSVAQTEKDLKRAFPASLWKKRHLQMIYFGREYCKARGHLKKNCPICGKLFPVTGP